MKSAYSTGVIVVMAAVFSLTALPARAAVLCAKRSGAVVVRDACKKKETALDLAQFGAVIEGAPAAGDLSGSYPAPTIAAAPAPTAVAANPQTATDPCAGPSPQTGIHCGTSTRYWTEVSFLPGVKFWRDRLGGIHVRGSVAVSPGIDSSPIFYLPAGSRPTEVQTFPVVIGFGGAFDSGIAWLWVYPDGRVSVFSPSIPNQTEVFFGEIEFRPDA